MHIRLALPPDAAAIAEIYRPFVASTPVSFEIAPPDADEIRRRMEAAHPNFPWLVCESDNRVAGYAHASNHRDRAAYQWSVNVSIYLDPAFHRRGIGRALYTSLLEILTAQGYCNAYAGITLPNPASVALHESLGFQSVGVYRNVGYKQGRWHDVGWWQLALRESGETPGPLLPATQPSHN